jgi:Rab GTPase-binding effector protein 1
VIEDSLNGDIKKLKDILRARDEEIRVKNNRIAELKSQAGGSSSSSHVSIDDILREKEAIRKENSEMGGKISTLRKELTNSEELQKDLIALSKSLQVELERVRQAETEVRWQHPDDISHCNSSSCKKPLNDKRDKHHCSHCGRIFCGDCVSQTVRRGTRDYPVCEFCHTVLAHDSAPYFSTEPPHSPD